MLGHASVAITLNRYGHHYPGDVHMYVDRLGALAWPRVRTICGPRPVRDRQQVSRNSGKWASETWPTENMGR